MITVYESLQAWITDIFNDPKNGFPRIFTVIDLENIPNQQEFPGMGLSGLFSSPNDDKKLLIGGQVKHIVFKSFYVRRTFFEFTERFNNEAFFEKFERCVYERNINGTMPKDGREWISIEINAGIYPAQIQEGNRFADYIIPLKLTFIS